jgi:broad specificity phosphatase PhoE
MAGPERKLILVRHSLPEMVAGVPASRWHLSAEGRRRCRALAGRLARQQPTIVVASQEPKAVETGQIVASSLGLPFETAPGLHEHERGVVRDPGNREAFQAQVAAFFERPGELVLGHETADAAHGRFARAVARVLARHPTGNPAIVSHGTVMTLFVARSAAGKGLDPLSWWQGLGLPAFAVLSLPDLELLEVVTEVGGAAR